MALTRCPECEREISDQAAACPHCGHPLQQAPLPEAQQTVIQQPQGSSLAKGVGSGFGGCLGILLFLLVLMVIGGVISQLD